MIRPHAVYKPMFETSDLHMAAYLLSEGCEALAPKIINGRRVVFVFTDQARCEALALSFCQGRAVVEARRFLDAQGRARDLRDLALAATRLQNNQEAHHATFKDGGR